MSDSHRYSTLLDPSLTALDPFVRLAKARRPGASGQLDGARQFIEYKAYVTLHLGEEIREQQTSTVTANAASTHRYSWSCDAHRSDRLQGAG